MRKIYLIPGIILLLIALSIFVVSQNYKNSPDYNYVSAKLDIARGNARIVKTGFRIPYPMDAQIDSIAGKYGFKPVYIGNDTTKQLMKGERHYNEMIEAYLMIRNGNHWKANYQRDIDSLYTIVADPELP